MRNHKLVYVEWEDASGLSHWRDDTTAKDALPIPVRSIGWLMAKNKKCITIAASLNNQGEHSDRNTIPKGCIIKIMEVKLK